MKKEDGPGDLKENRRRNLVLIAEHYGERRQKDLANDLAMDASYLSQLLTGKTGMGDKARDYERLLGLPKYWLDEAHAADEPIPFGAAPKQDIQEELAEKRAEYRVRPPKLRQEDLLQYVLATHQELTRSHAALSRALQILCNCATRQMDGSRMLFDLKEAKARAEEEYPPNPLLTELLAHMIQQVMHTTTGGRPT